MRINKLDFEKINFNYVAYNISMYYSIKRIGLSFPIKVVVEDNQYYCKDGHKRLSIIHDLLKSGGSNELSQVSAIILNDGSSRSNDCWRSRNTH